MIKKSKIIAITITTLLFVPQYVCAQSETVLTPPMEKPIDPLTLSKAHLIADAMIEKGAFEKMFGPMMDQLMVPAFDQMLDLPVRDFARAGGLNEMELKNLSPATLREMTAIMDPVFSERMTVMTHTMFAELGPIMTKMEPDVRDGMAEAFAYKYSNSELDEINIFLATPTGAKFGGGFMSLATDPHYIKKMQGLMPRIMKAMPDILQKAITATNALPAPKTYKDLSRSERAKLAELMGVDPEKLK